MEIIKFITNHKTEIIALLGGLVTVASIIVKLTPTPKDNAVLAKIINILDKLALNPKKEV